jgi:CDP-diacylglycerol--glycerol-3-phosphate 3-phosphatidyltransferase
MLPTKPRHQDASSKFGAFLDPVADKLMVAAALILLCTQPLAAGALAGNTWLVPASTLGEARGARGRRCAAGALESLLCSSNEPAPARSHPLHNMHRPSPLALINPPPVIIGREITMSALREWAATLGPTARDAVAVNAWGKWKTAAQMVALTCLLLTRDGIAAGAAGAELALLQAAAAAGPPLLIVASYLSAHSLALYLKGLWRFMAE